VARNLGGTDRATGHHTARNRDERHPRSGAPAVVLHFGLSDLKLMFDEAPTTVGTANGPWEQPGASQLAAGRDSADANRLEPVGQIYFFTLHSTNPAIDVMEFEVD